MSEFYSDNLNSVQRELLDKLSEKIYAYMDENPEMRKIGAALLASGLRLLATQLGFNLERIPAALQPVPTTESKRRIFYVSQDGEASLSVFTAKDEEEFRTLFNITLEEPDKR